MYICIPRKTVRFVLVGAERARTVVCMCPSGPLGPQQPITMFAKLADLDFGFLTVGAVFIALKFNDVGILWSRPWWFWFDHYSHKSSSRRAYNLNFFITDITGDIGSIGQCSFSFLCCRFRSYFNSRICESILCFDFDRKSKCWRGNQRGWVRRHDKCEWVFWRCFRGRL